jgi:hypothetical protein
MTWWWIWSITCYDWAHKRSCYRIPEPDCDHPSLCWPAIKWYRLDLMVVAARLESPLGAVSSLIEPTLKSSNQTNRTQFEIFQPGRTVHKQGVGSCSSGCVLQDHECEGLRPGGGWTHQSEPPQTSHIGGTSWWFGTSYSVNSNLCEQLQEMVSDARLDIIASEAQELNLTL